MHIHLYFILALAHPAINMLLLESLDLSLVNIKINWVTIIGVGRIKFFIRGGNTL